MQINKKSLAEWTLEDIRTLLGDEQWRESATMDYKREFKARDEAFKKDVCAFANAQGGYLFMGIDEEDGLATAIVGIDDVGLDSFNLGISNALSSSIEPSRPAYESHLIPLDAKKCVLIIHVLEGYDKPYRVRNEGRFWIRGNAGNESMSYMAIEEMFLRTFARKDTLQQLVDSRLEFLEKPGHPAYLQYAGAPTVALHFVPLSPVSGHEKRYPIKTTVERTEPLLQLAHSGAAQIFRLSESKINMDGFIAFAQENGGAHSGQAHIQLFWNGIVEAVTSSIFVSGDAGALTLPASVMKLLIADLLEAVLALYGELGMTEPFSIVLSIENALKCRVLLPTGQQLTPDRDRLRTYPVRIDDRGPEAVGAAVLALLDEFGYLIGLTDFHKK